MRVENEFVIVLNEKCVLNGKKCDNTVYGQKEGDVNGAKPKQCFPKQPNCVSNASGEQCQAH
jgi:hypothetical protein